MTQMSQRDRRIGRFQVFADQKRMAMGILLAVATEDFRQAVFDMSRRGQFAKRGQSAAPQPIVLTVCTGGVDDDIRSRDSFDTRFMLSATRPQEQLKVDFGPLFTRHFSLEQISSPNTEDLDALMKVVG